jgi:hypothetical protein
VNGMLSFKEDEMAGFMTVIESVWRQRKKK